MSIWTPSSDAGKSAARESACSGTEKKVIPDSPRTYQPDGRTPPAFYDAHRRKHSPSVRARAVSRNGTWLGVRSGHEGVVSVLRGQGEKGQGAASEAKVQYCHIWFIYPAIIAPQRFIPSCGRLRQATNKNCATVSDLTTPVSIERQVRNPRAEREPTAIGDNDESRSESDPVRALREQKPHDGCDITGFSDALSAVAGNFAGF